MANVEATSPERHGGANRTMIGIVILALVILAVLILYMTMSGHHEIPSPPPSQGTTSGGTAGGSGRR